MSNFVLSSNHFETIKEAEVKINAWYRSGNLENKKVKLYKVVEVYDLGFKFVKRKKKG